MRAQERMRVFLGRSDCPMGGGGGGGGGGGLAFYLWRMGM